jgi:hypothetical protein
MNCPSILIDSANNMFWFDFVRLEPSNTVDRKRRRGGGGEEAISDPNLVKKATIQCEPIRNLSSFLLRCHY